MTTIIRLRAEVDTLTQAEADLRAALDHLEAAWRKPLDIVHYVPRRRRSDKDPEDHRT